MARKQKANRLQASATDHIHSKHLKVSEMLDVKSVAQIAL